MEKQKYLFDASNRYGGTVKGVREFEIDFLKVAIEDKEFFTDNWRVINPNDFGDEDVRFILGKMVDIKTNGLMSVTYSNLEMYITSRFNAGDFNLVFYHDYLDAIEHREIDKERFEEVKNIYMYIGLYNNMLRLGGYCIENVKEGFLNPKALLNCYDEIEKRFEKLKESRAKLVVNSDGITLKSRYDDEDF